MDGTVWHLQEHYYCQARLKAEKKSPLFSFLDLTCAPDYAIIIPEGKRKEVKEMKQNKIKGGIYCGRWWRDFYTNKEAKHFAHRQERRRWKKFCKMA